jgi:hypothetical protein
MSVHGGKSEARVYCNIYTWIEDHDAKFAHAMSRMCAVGLLSARKYGKTFLFPPEEVRKEIIKKSVTGDEKEFDAATTLLKAYVIQSALSDGAAFQKKPAPTNLNGTSLTATSAAGDTVKLEGNVVLKRADDFVADSRKNISVWLVTEGKLGGSVGGRRIRSRRGPVSGGDEDSQASAAARCSSDRVRYTDAVMAQYKIAVRLRTIRNMDPFVCCTASLLNLLKSRYPDIYAGVAPFIDRRAIITWYLIVEPYKASGHIIPDAVMKAWGGIPMDGGGAASMYSALFEDLGNLNSQYPCLAFSDPSSIASVVDCLRFTLIGSKDMTAAVGDEIMEYYDALGRNFLPTTENGRIEPIFPQASINLGIVSKCRLLWQDAFRFIVGTDASEVEQSGGQDRTCDELFTKIYTMTSVDFADAIYNNFSEIRGVNPQGGIDKYYSLINSTDFLYVARSEKDATTGMAENCPSNKGAQVPLEGEEVFNAEYPKIAELKMKVGNEDPISVPEGAIALCQYILKATGASQESFLA